MNGLVVLVLLSAGVMCGWFLRDWIASGDYDALRDYYTRRADKWDNRGSAPVHLLLFIAVLLVCAALLLEVI